jgi:hypothetical protein
MDILNWLYLVKNKFTRTTVENPSTDLIVLGADVSFTKRGDKYQNYVMTAADFAASFVNPQFISTTDGTIVTGSTSVKTSTSVLIPANTVKVGDSIFIRTRGRKTGTAGIAVQSIYVNTAGLGPATNISLTSMGATSLYAQTSRTLVVKATNNTEMLNVNTGGVDDDATSTNAVSTFNIDWTVDQYLIFAFQNANAADSTVTSYYEVTVNKG